MWTKILISDHSKTTEHTIAGDPQTQRMAQCVVNFDRQLSKIGPGKVLFLGPGDQATMGRLSKALFAMVAPSVIGDKNRNHSLVFLSKPGQDNSRRVCRALFDLLEDTPNLVVLGLKWNDSVPREGSDRPRVEIEDYALRLHYIFSVINVCFQIPIVWVNSAEISLEANELTAAYQSLAERVCQEYEIPFVDLDGNISTTCESPILGEAEDELLMYLSRLRFKFSESTYPMTTLVASEEDAEWDVALGQRASGVAQRLLEPFKIRDQVTTRRIAANGWSLDSPGARNPYELFQQWGILCRTQEDKPPRTPRVLVIGDSVFMRLQSTTGWGIEFYRLSEGIFNIVHLPHHVGGSRSVLNHLGVLLELQPDIVVLNLGLHDLTRGEDDESFVAHAPPQEFERNIREIISLFLSRGASVVIVGLSPVEESKYNQGIMRRNDDVREYSRILKSVASDLELFFVDIYPLFFGPEQSLLPLFQADGGHLNISGSLRIGRKIFGAVESAASEGHPS